MPAALCSRAWRFRSIWEGAAGAAGAGAAGAGAGAAGAGTGLCEASLISLSVIGPPDAAGGLIGELTGLLCEAPLISWSVIGPQDTAAGVAAPCMLARWAATLSAVGEAAGAGAAGAPIVPNSFICAPPFALYWSRIMSKVPASLALAMFCALASSGEMAAPPLGPRLKKPGLAAYIEPSGLPSVEILFAPRDKPFRCSEARPVIRP